MPNEEVIGTAVLELTTDDSSLRKGLAEGERDAGEWSKDVGEQVRGSLGSVLSVAGGMIAVQGIRAIGAGISEMLKTAVQLEPVRDTFDNLIESVGGDAVNAMDAMRDATRGMVDEAQLLAAGNRLLAMGIADSTAGLSEQIEVATQLGASMGVTAAKAIEDWALLNANLSFERLDLYGISAGKVRVRTNELMAAVKGLSREQAFQTATMEEARVALDRVGEQGIGTAADLARVAAQTQNVKTLFGEVIVSALEVSGAFGTVSKALTALRENLERGQTVQELQQDLKDLRATGDITGEQFDTLRSQANALQLQLRRGRIDAEEFAAGLKGIENAIAAITELPPPQALEEFVAGLDFSKAKDEITGFARQSQVAFDTFERDMRELSALMGKTDLAAALEDALDAEAIGDAIRDMGVRAAQIMEDIQADFAAITEQGADQRREILFSHNLAQLEAQARFDNEFAALTAAGRTEDANNLAASFDDQRALTDRQLAIRLQLQERSILREKIVQAKAYIAELTQQGDQIRRVFATELAASESFQKLEILTQQAILDAIFEGGSAQLQLEASMAEARRQISAEISAGIITDAITAREAVVAAIGGDLGAAKRALDDLQGILDGWKPELPPLPTFDLGDVGDDGAGTDRQIAETVTKPLSQAVNEIARAITAAKGAIEDLIGFELGEGVEQGFDELGRFVALGITKFQSWFEDDPGLEPALDAIKDLFGPVGELLQLLSIDVSKLASFAGDFLPEAERFVSQIRDFTALVQPWLADIATFWGVEEVELWAEAAKHLKAFFGIMPDLAKIDPVEGPDFTRDAIRYISQLREFGGIIQPWLAAVVEFWTVERVEEWGKAAQSLKNFFAIFPDLSKIQPVEGETFSDDALRYVWQVREFVKFVKPWLEDIVRWWTPELVAQWGEAAQQVARFFDLMPDLSLVAPVEATTFTADAARYVWQIREFVKNLKPWLEDVARWWTPERVEEWADVAQNLAKFFDLMPDFSVVTPFPGDFKTAFRAFVANIDIAATELMRELERVRTGPLGDVLEELAKTADQLGSVLGLLSLASMFEDLQRVRKLKKGERRTALSNVVVVFIEQLKRASEQLKKALPEIEKIWDGMLDKAIVFAEKIAAFFTAIRDAIVAGGDIVRETDFDVDAIMRQINLLATLGTRVAAVQFPSLVPVGADPSMPVMPVLAGERREPRDGRGELSGHAVLNVRLIGDIRAEVARQMRGLEIRLIDQAAGDTARGR